MSPESPDLYPTVKKQEQSEGASHMKKVNFIVKAYDVKEKDIKKALKNAGIEVRSVGEIYREEEKVKEENHADKKT
jgi:hypothetical protein